MKLALAIMTLLYWGGGDRSTMVTQEYTSVESCENARKTIKSSEINGMFGQKLWSVCTTK